MTEEHFDAIVVGSGFGGSVAAYRLAEAGRSVCLLERGKAYPPGSFPRSPYRMRENFWDPSARLHGAPRFTCRLVGECDLGCNFGSKNTLDFTYLSAAKDLGADLRTRTEVRSLEPASGGGYRVGYVDHATEPAGRVTLTADRLVVAAGTFDRPTSSCATEAPSRS